MTQSGEGNRKRGAYTAVLAVVALALMAFFGRLGLGVSVTVLAVGLIAVGVGYALRNHKSPARD